VPVGAYVLDVGCGDGLLTERMALDHPNANVVGVDVNEELLARATRRAAAHAVRNVSYRCADVTQRLDDRRYDVVTAIECLEEISDDGAAIENMAAALRPNGVIVVHVPERTWQPALPGSAPTWRHEVRHGYGAGDIEAVLGASGIDVLEITATSHVLIRILQEVWERGNPARPSAKLLFAPATAAIVRAERAGFRIGQGRALLVVGRRR
jgi:SAM-dependent methyltransferase